MPLAALLRPFSSAAVRNLSPAARGALWMTVGGLALACLNMLIREAATLVHPFQAAFFRSSFGLLFMLPWLAHVGLRGLRTKRLGLNITRGVMAVATMLAWFTALTLLPLAEAVTISFTAPLLAVAGAALLLGEQVGPRRWSAVLVGFVGTLVVLRPGVGALNPGALYALAAALGITASMLQVKLLARTDHPNTIVIWLVMCLTVGTFIFAVPVWTWPALHQWPLMVSMGAVGTVGHLCLVRGLAAADAAVVMPFDYLRLPFVAALGFGVYGEWPDLWTWLGAGIIVGASIYVARREAKLKAASRVSITTPTVEEAVGTSPEVTANREAAQ